VGRSCECGDEPSDYGAMELVNINYEQTETMISIHSLFCKER
jgi:hypothetical protein